MSQETPIFGIDSGLSPLNAFLEFPEDMRTTVLKALELSATYSLPSGDEIYQTRRIGGFAEKLIEDIYGDVADGFAKAIDRSFKGFRDKKPLGEENSPETEELRGKYYNMIRALSAGQVLRGVQEIKRRGLVEENPRT